MPIYIISNRRTIHYKSNIIPKINEFIYLPHFGTFEVKKIVYHISDDCEDNNELMWVDIYVNKENF